MKGIVTFTVTIEANRSEVISQLTDEVAPFGFSTTLTETETGEPLHLPVGTYACPIQIDDQTEQMEYFYRGLVEIMRGLNIKGKYFINMAHQPISYVCGEL